MNFSKFLFLKILVSILITVFSTSTAFGKIEIVTDGLVGFWTLDKSTIVGKTVEDSLGNNHGTIEGEPKIVDGRINDALSFDGEDDYVEIGHSESLNLKEAITIECWFLLNGDSTDNEFPRVVSKGQSTTEDGAYSIWVKDTRGATDIGFRSVTLTPNDIRSLALPNYNDDAWHHVAVTYDGEVGRLYLDGVIHVDIPVNGDIAQTDEHLHIGDGNGQRHFNGIIDEVRIYNRGLDEKEIIQNFSAKSNSLAINAKSKLATLWSHLKSVE